MTTITLDDILQTMDEPVSDLPLKTIIDAYFDGTKHMHDFGREVMIPQLKALLVPNPQEIALRDIYFKMHLLLGSAVTMNRLDHFQSVAALTRSLFELLLDMKIIAADKIGDAVKRYNEFPEIERYRRAQQLIAFDAQHLGQIKHDLSAQRTFVSDSARQARVTTAIGAKKRYPEHWSGMNARDRACNALQIVRLFVCGTCGTPVPDPYVELLRAQGKDLFSCPCGGTVAIGTAQNKQHL